MAPSIISCQHQITSDTRKPDTVDWHESLCFRPQLWDSELLSSVPEEGTDDKALFYISLPAYLPSFFSFLLSFLCFSFFLFFLSFFLSFFFFFTKASNIKISEMIQAHPGELFYFFKRKGPWRNFLTSLLFNMTLSIDVFTYLLLVSNFVTQHFL